RMHRQSASFARWADYYDDLAAIFSHEPEALGGRSIILDQDRRLTRALGDASSKQTVFFAPDDDSDNGVSRLPRDLRPLRRRLTSAHPEIPGTFASPRPRRRPGRRFLEPLLVREFRTDRVFEALDELLEHSHTDAFRRDALLFAFRQYPSLNDAQRTQ